MIDGCSLSSIPVLGSGLGYRSQIRNEIHGSTDLDFVEIITEQFIDRPRKHRELVALAEKTRVIPHGVSLSIGSLHPPKHPFLNSIREICEITDAPYYSEHLCMTASPGVDIGHLSPVCFNNETLAATINNVEVVQDFLRRPLILENITYPFVIPGGDFSQSEFFSRLCESTGCGILLDVTNLYINSTNHSESAASFLSEIPLDRVIQIHLAGGVSQRKKIIDSHSNAVPEEVWEMLKSIVEMTNIRGSIVERDSDFPTFDELLAEVSIARQIIYGEPGNA